ncbi:MAG: NYN domain-containing protein [Pikeienuella sp.]|uniref:NYN domain-containing protein n=1 Tax=Pikeienuella sp. TaxID=2831957 RepID=UPI00391AEF54
MREAREETAGGAGPLNRAPRLAVLIDADNASPKIAGDLFREIAKIGEASVRRIYGDFSSGQLASWLKVLPEHAILPQMNQANTTGKNASDIALVIDAMDLLHTGRFDGFCLVSSDSDFTRLAARIREQGVAVYGFGQEKTPKSFVQACQRFIYTENFVVSEAPTSQGEAQGEAPKRPGGRKSPEDAMPLFIKAMGELAEDSEYVHLGALGQLIANMEPDFDPRSYGCAKLSSLVEKTGRFEIERNDGFGVQIRLLPKPKPRRG